MMDGSFNIIPSTLSFLLHSLTQENYSRGSLNKILSFLSQMVYSNS